MRQQNSIYKNINIQIKLFESYFCKNGLITNNNFISVKKLSLKKCDNKFIDDIVFINLNCLKYEFRDVRDKNEMKKITDWVYEIYQNFIEDSYFFIIFYLPISPNLNYCLVRPHASYNPTLFGESDRVPLEGNDLVYCLYNIKEGEVPFIK